MSQQQQQQQPSESPATQSQLHWGTRDLDSNRLNAMAAFQLPPGRPILPPPPTMSFFESLQASEAKEAAQQKSKAQSQVQAQAQAQGQGLGQAASGTGEQAT